MKKYLSIVLAVIIMMSVTAVAGAEGKVDTDYTTGRLNLITYNVAGLPIPSKFAKDNKNVFKDTKEIGSFLAKEDFDVLGVQEDFNLHSILASIIGSNYATKTSGGIPAGSGLNFYSKYPIYNVERYKWNKMYGVFDGANDELTPKGILKATIEIADGVYIDFYDLHADAYDGEKNAEARIDNFNQLSELINRESADRAVIVMGDTNTYIASPKARPDDIYHNLIVAANLKDAWVEVINGGNYDTKSQYTWGKYNSVDRVMYRDGGGVKLEAITHEYVDYYSAVDSHNLSDHSSTHVTLQYSYLNTVPKKDSTLKTEGSNFLQVIVNYIKGVYTDIVLMLNDLDTLKTLLNK